MRGRLASRAHSFKENFLNVFGHHSPHSSSNQQHDSSCNSSTVTNSTFEENNEAAGGDATTAAAPKKPGKSSNPDKLVMAKKTNSTDNIIDFVTTSTNTVADPRNTEVMVREVHLALRYFQDAVVKGTYELLPGCATVVLETILALQSYAMSRRDPRKKTWGADNKASGNITASTKAMCSAVAKLTQWADRVITDGCVDPTEDYVNQVIDPVRLAVNALASNLLAISVVVPKSTSFHNSLPDLASPERENPGGGSSRQPMSYVEPARPPPLPPKNKSQSQSDDSMDPVMTSSDVNAHVDWFSNPLFDNADNPAAANRRCRPRSSRHSSSGKKRSSRTYSESSSMDNKSELDTTLPDFCQPQRMSICEQTNVSYIDVSPNLMRDPFDYDSPLHGPSGGVVPLATSSPRLEPSFPRTPIQDHNPDNTSSSTSSDIPPALPRKNRQPPLPPPTSGRKISTYDNVFLPPASFAGAITAGAAPPPFPTFQGFNKMDLFDQIEAPPTTVPPPLPPKKKHIMSYMEMFGRSLVATDEEAVHSLTRNKDLLEAVWQQNYHDYSFNSMSSAYDLSSGGFTGRHGGYRHFNDLVQTTFQFSGMGVRPIIRTSMSSYHLPPPELPPPPPPLLITAQSSGMPPPFPNLPDDEDDNQGDLEDDDDPTTDDIYPPALPPKRGPLTSRSWMPGGGQMPTTTSHDERIIPIVIEGRKGRGGGSGGGPYRQESTSSAVSAQTPVSDNSANPPRIPGGHQYHRFSDSMTSSTSSSGFGTDIHSLRHSLPSPVMEASNSSQQQIMSEGNEPMIQPSISKQASRKSKTKETSPLNSKSKRSSSKKKKSSSSSVLSGSVLDQMDVRKACLDMLVYTASTEDPKGTRAGKELLRAGSVDALIVLATQSVKNDFLYQEAFMATYRTFVSTHDLLEKLVQRFRKFNNRRDERAQQQMVYKRVAHCAFSLMVRVVDGLADCDFQDTSVMELLSDFIAELVNDGELILARALRTKFIQKYEDRKLRLLPVLNTTNLSSNKSASTNLLSFKSVDLAEQMTLLDAQLFLRLDSAELILWVQEQNEDKSPNLTKFTEHFNNMSFWCRTKILQQEDGKERERLVSKFIKIMKELRKHNNFNSYLALLSALDSAPIRRLEWCKSISEAIKEHCALIDSSCSFRAYRQALSSSSSPCIPYVGLVLQDLTFVHIGNPDTFDGKVNFAKRWQQFNILDNLMRFKKKTYPFERKEEIIHFFDDFVNYWNEDKMWSVSESIKPRGRRNNSR